MMAVSSLHKGEIVGRVLKWGVRDFIPLSLLAPSLDNCFWGGNF